MDRMNLDELHFLCWSVKHVRKQPGRLLDSSDSDIVELTQMFYVVTNLHRDWGVGLDGLQTASAHTILPYSQSFTLLRFASVCIILISLSFSIPFHFYLN